MKIFLTVLLSLDIIRTILQIEKPREPITPAEAVGVTITGGLLIAGIWKFL